MGKTATPVEAQSDKLLTPTEMAAIVNVHVGTLLRWAREGKIPSVAISRRIVRFDRDAVRAALEGQSQ